MRPVCKRRVVRNEVFGKSFEKRHGVFYLSSVFYSLSPHEFCSINQSRSRAGAEHDRAADPADPFDYGDFAGAVDPCDADVFYARNRCAVIYAHGARAPTKRRPTW